MISMRQEGARTSRAIQLSAGKAPKVKRANDNKSNHILEWTEYSECRGQEAYPDPDALKGTCETKMANCQHCKFEIMHQFQDLCTRVVDDDRHILTVNSPTLWLW